MEDGGGFAKIGRSAVPGIRLYRAAALTSGDAGTLVSLSWDATSSLLAKLAYTHSTSSNAEQITVAIAGRHRLHAVVRFAEALLLTGVRLEIQVGGVPVARAALPANGSAIVVSGETAIEASAEVDLVPGAVIRVQYAGQGAANTPLVVGDGYTWFSGVMIG